MAFRHMTSSMVSINVRVNIPNVAKNRTKKPMRIFCPKENSRSIAQTTSGTFLKDAAIILTARASHGLTLVVFVPSKLKKERAYGTANGDGDRYKRGLGQLCENIRKSRPRLFNGYKILRHPHGGLWHRLKTAGKVVVCRGGGERKKGEHAEKDKSKRQFSFNEYRGLIDRYQGFFLILA
ncbi:MAG: hypothetical protein LBU32_14135 [Clostridiales bacterium]|nr:hypothetical protein [Clostridiales bacterium]